MRTIRLAISGVLAIGCSGVNLQIATDSCVNPRNVKGQCESPLTDSRILELRVYSLKHCVSPALLPWQDLQSPGATKLLAPLLSGSSELTTSPQLLVEPQHSYELTVPRSLGSHCLLLVTHGRREGQQSVVQVPVGLFTDHVTVYVHEFDICVGAACKPTPQGE